MTLMCTGIGFAVGMFIILIGLLAWLKPQGKVAQALDMLGEKLIQTIASTTFWFNVIGFIVAAFLAFKEGGLEQIIALLVSLGFGANYAVARTKQRAQYLDAANGSKTVKDVPKQITPAPGLIAAQQYSSEDLKIKILPPVVPNFPVPNTNPFFDSSDDVLVPKQKEEVQRWYNKVVTDKATMPIVETYPAEGYKKIHDRDAKRIQDATNELAFQAATKIFPGNDLILAYQMREKCDNSAIRRLNWHWDMAMNDWVVYNLALWQYYEGLK